MFRHSFSIMSRLSSPTMFRRINNMSTYCISPKIAINGFGRIGKSLLRKSFEKDVNVSFIFLALRLIEY